jgi:preprotein translocase subunit SecA
MRAGILEAADLRGQTRTMIGSVIEATVTATPDPARLRDALADLYSTGLGVAELAVGRGPAAAAQLTALVTADALAAYERQETEFGPAVLREVERMVRLNVIDQEWRDHLADLGILLERATAGGSAANDPLAAYRHSAAESYDRFLRRVEWRVVGSLYHLEVAR